MTEDEAMTKWCPASRARSVGGVLAGYNRQAIGGLPDGTACIGSECMAWRWLPLRADDAYAEAVRKAADETGDTSSSRSKAARHVNANRAKYGPPTEPFNGFCGLAGRPV